MSPTAVSTRAVRRWGAGTAAIVRLLVASDAPLTGVAIARTIGVTQPRASQVLRHLSEHEAIAATPDGYLGDRERLLDLYRERARPDLREPESHWYSTRPLVDQARRLLSASADKIAIALSADLAPDLIVPWRHPTLAIVYVDAVPAMEDAGFVPAEGRADATLVLRWTSDQTLLTPAPPWRAQADGLPVVDPCQQWWDLVDLGGEDRAEAAARLRQAMLERTLPKVG